MSPSILPLLTLLLPALTQEADKSNENGKESQIQKNQQPIVYVLKFYLLAIVIILSFILAVWGCSKLCKFCCGCYEVEEQKPIHIFFCHRENELLLMCFVEKKRSKNGELQQISARNRLPDEQVETGFEGYRTLLDQQEQCSICLEQYTPDQWIVRLKCSHFLHIDCFQNWSQASVNPFCPLCRAPI